MPKIFFTLSVLLLILGCGSQKQETVDATAAQPEIAGTETAQSPNALTAEEISEGWVLLFDGETMKSWKVFKDQENDSWEVDNGTLHCRPFNDNGPNKRADLVTVDQYENFDLKFEWKITAQANTGVMFRVTEELQETYMTGPEFQIVDDEGYPGDLEDTQLTGATYHMYAPAETRKVNPVGEWNQSRITVNKNLVEHWLNGSKIASYELHSPDWKDRITSSKWRDFPQFGIPSKGHIALQDHRNEVWFRNLKIKPL